MTTKQSSPLKNSLKTFWQGFAIGAANTVPGVSGGTLALIFGIYETLINSLKAFGQAQTLQALVKLQIAEVFRRVNGRFLFTLILGAALALLSLARVLGFLFESQPSLVLSFFFGLILASLLPISRYIKEWTPTVLLAASLGTIIGFLLVGLNPGSIPDTLPMFFLSGALAATALILPGISGAFVLVLLGNYDTILNALNKGQLLIIATVLLGGVIGVLSLAQLLSWLLKKYKAVTLAILSGFMLGSLRKIWPWKEAGFGDKEVPVNVLPNVMMNGQLNFEFLTSAALIIVGIGLILLLDRITKANDT